MNGKKKGKALILVHNGIKKNMDGRTLSYIFPQDLCTAIFNTFKGYDGNEIKLLLFLLGNKGDGLLNENYSVPVKTITKMTGISKTSYYSARDRLEDMGWITITDNKLIVNVDKILKEGMEKANKTAKTVDSEK